MWVPVAARIWVVTKLPKDPKRKQIAEVIIDNDKYMQIEYIDYELSENDSIYEVSDIETENEEENINIDNNETDEEIYSICDFIISAFLLLKLIPAFFTICINFSNNLICSSCVLEYNNMSSIYTIQFSSW